MDHRRTRTGTSVDVVPDGADELDEGLRGLRDSVVGPHGVVELAHQPREVQLLLLTHTQTHTHTETQMEAVLCLLVFAKAAGV